MKDLSESKERNLETDLTKLTVQLLSLSQDLISTKLKLENVSKNGWIMMAKTRYVNGGVSSVSVNQVPNDDIVSTIRLHSTECTQENDVRYHHFNIADEIEAENVPEEEENGVRLRKGINDCEIVSRITPTKLKTKDPIKWFGVLSPPSLRQSQTSFKSAIELAIDCANIQSEIQGVINRIKYIKRILKKPPIEDIPEDDIENLDSKFSESVQV